MYVAYSKNSNLLHDQDRSMFLTHYSVPFFTMFSPVFCCFILSVKALLMQ